MCREGGYGCKYCNVTTPFFCLAVPDISVDGCLSVTHIMLDKRQLELVKGLLDMNLGEDIEEFEKPSTLIHDPVLQVQQCISFIREFVKNIARYIFYFSLWLLKCGLVSTLE